MTLQLMFSSSLARTEANLTKRFVTVRRFYRTSRHHFDTKTMEGTSTQNDRINSDSSSEEASHFT